MKDVTRLGIGAYLLAALVVALDQASKFWILNVLDLPSKVTVPVGGPFHMTFVWNKGVSFGLLRAEVDLTRWALAAFRLAEVPGVAVEPLRADGCKCTRCWRILPEVAAPKNLCLRCEQAVEAWDAHRATEAV